MTIAVAARGGSAAVASLLWGDWLPAGIWKAWFPGSRGTGRYWQC